MSVWNSFIGFTKASLPVKKETNLRDAVPTKTNSSYFCTVKKGKCFLPLRARSLMDKIKDSGSFALGSIPSGLTK